MVYESGLKKPGSRKDKTRGFNPPHGYKPFKSKLRKAVELGWTPPSSWVQPNGDVWPDEVFFNLLTRDPPAMPERYNEQGSTTTPQGSPIGCGWYMVTVIEFAENSDIKKELNARVGIVCKEQLLNQFAGEEVYCWGSGMVSIAYKDKKEDKDEEYAKLAERNGVWATVELENYSVADTSKVVEVSLSSSASVASDWDARSTTSSKKGVATTSKAAAPTSTVRRPPPPPPPMETKPKAGAQRRWVGSASSAKSGG